MLAWIPPPAADPLSTSPISNNNSHNPRLCTLNFFCSPFASSLSYTEILFTTRFQFQLFVGVFSSPLFSSRSKVNGKTKSFSRLIHKIPSLWHFRYPVYPEHYFWRSSWTRWFRYFQLNDFSFPPDPFVSVARNWNWQGEVSIDIAKARMWMVVCRKICKENSSPTSFLET